MSQGDKVTTTVRVQRSTIETLANIAREQGFSTVSRINISAATDYMAEFYRRMSGRQLVDPSVEYCTTGQPG